MARRDTETPWFSVTMDDCDLQTFCSGGPGGQHQNKSETGVRIIHRASGARGESRQERSQHQNKLLAWKRMAETQKFKTWLNREIYLRSGCPPAEERVKKDMQPQNLKVEVKDERGRWEPEDG